MIQELKEEIQFLQTQMKKRKLIKVEINFNMEKEPYILEFKYTLLDRDLRNVFEIEGWWGEVKHDLELYLDKYLLPLPKDYQGYYRYTDNLIYIEFKKKK